MFVVLLLAVQVAVVGPVSHALRQYVAIGYAALQIISVLLAIHIDNEPGELSYKLIWFVLLLLAPVTGLIRWRFVGRRRAEAPPAPRRPARSGRAGERARPQRDRHG